MAISPMPHKTDTTLTGAAGEHLVLSRLLQRGIVAAQAPEGVRLVDILVTFLDGREPWLIQVKSRQFGSDGGWHMQEKHEHIVEPNILYCFVDFEPEDPSVYVVPASVVAEVLRVDHQTWLDTPGKNGRQHKENKMRRLKPRPNGYPAGWLDEYRERWDLISDSATN